MAEARWIRGLVDVFRAEAGTVLGVRSSSFVIPGADSLHQPPVQHGNVCKHRIRFHFRFEKTLPGLQIFSLRGRAQHCLNFLSYQGCRR